jgi:hypothetical protein
MKIYKILLCFLFIIITIIGAILAAPPTTSQQSPPFTEGYDISGATNISGATDISGNIPTSAEIDNTIWDKNKVNINTVYHDDPQTIANRYGLPFGTTMVADKSGNMLLLKGTAPMAAPVYFDPSNQIYNPTSFVPNYSESVLLSSHVAPLAAFSK